MLKKVVFILLFACSFTANLVATAHLPLVQIDCVSGGIIEVVQINRDQIDLQMNEAGVTLQLINSSNVVVYDNYVSQSGSYTIDISQLSLGSYTLVAKYGMDIQSENIEIED
jgi:hypothetical protein